MKVRPDLSEQLQDQVGFLRTSCGLFDNGQRGEAKRIAISIRILVLDRGRSHSLLGQLGYKDSLKFLSLAVPNKASNLGPYWGVLDLEVTRRIYVPKLNQVPPRPMSFEDWWQEPVLKDGDDTLYTRKKLVLEVAETDGGAHVDPKMNEAYERLSRENHVGMEVAVNGKVIKWNENPVFPSVRHIGHELLETLKAVREGV